MDKNSSTSSPAIHYKVTGTGTTVLLVHGFGETGDVWNDQVEYLARFCRVIVPDLPGSGSSPITGTLTMEQMAEELNNVLVYEQTGPVHLIGHSMGGYVALAFAEKFPAQLKSLGLFHSTAFADSDEKISTRRKGIAFIREHGAFAFLKSSAPNLFSPATKAEKPDLIDAFISSLSNFSAESLVLYYESMIKRPDRTAVLKTAPWPILIVIGKHDAAIPPEDTLKLCHMAEISYIHTLYRSGHMGMLEEKENSNHLLEEFITRSEPF